MKLKETWPEAELILPVMKKDTCTDGDTSSHCSVMYRLLRFDLKCLVSGSDMGVGPPVQGGVPLRCSPPNPRHEYNEGDHGKHGQEDQHQVATHEHRGLVHCQVPPLMLSGEGVYSYICVYVYA